MCFGNIDLPRFHSNQCHPHSKRYLCDRCVTVSKCTEDDRSKVCVFRGSKVIGTTAKPFLGCRAGSQNWGIYFTLVCVQTFPFCAVLEVTVSRTSTPVEKEQELCLSCANWASELTTAMAVPAVSK